VAALIDERRPIAMRSSKPALGTAVSAVAALSMACVAAPLAGIAPSVRAEVLEPIIAAVSLAPSSPAPSSPAPIAVPTSSGRRGVVRTRRAALPAPAAIPPSPESENAVRVADLSTVESMELPLLTARPLDQIELRVEVPEQAARPAAQEMPWASAGKAGIAVAEGSKAAALTTARFFTRAGTSIAGAFLRE
jgi:hypothetical protein